MGDFRVFGGGASEVAVSGRTEELLHQWKQLSFPTVCRVSGRSLRRLLVSRSAGEQPKLESQPLVRSVLEGSTVPSLSAHSSVNMMSITVMGCFWL